MNSNNVEYLKIAQLEPFPNHPFKVIENEDFEVLINSIRDHGITSPLLVWETEDGQYILMSGHRRATASEFLSFTDERFAIVPCIIYRGITLEEATIIMVDENARREKLLPSEKAWAYRMKLEAMSRQGKRTDLTCATMLHKLEKEVPMTHNFEKGKTRELIGEAQGESGEQVRLYIRLTYLIHALLDYVDNGKLGFRAGTQLSYLSEDEQNAVLQKIRETQKFPTLKQAKLLKNASQAGELDAATLHRILTEITLDDRVSFRVKPAQRQQLEEMSANTQMSKSEILRTLSNTGKAVYVGRDTIEELADLRADVARVGNLMKMRHNTLSMIAENPFLPEQDRALITELYNQNAELYEDFVTIRKQLLEVCKKVNQAVNDLNKNK
jgi:ParB family chromosome partitioning protein